MTGPVISLLCPTRNRPANVRRMIGSAADTVEDPRAVEFVFYCDDDAPGSVPADIAGMPGIKVITGPRIVLSAMWNECFAACTGEIAMQCDDEAVFRSDGWDTLVREAFGAVPDRIAFVHGSDGHQPPDFGALGFLSREWVYAVGRFTPPYFSCDYGDTWINDVANAIGRRVFVPGLMIEHLHPIAGKAQWDATHGDRLARGGRDNVAALYASLAGEREADAAKLRAVMA